MQLPVCQFEFALCIKLKQSPPNWAKIKLKLKHTVQRAVRSVLFSLLATVLKLYQNWWSSTSMCRPNAGWNCHANLFYSCHKCQPDGRMCYLAAHQINTHSSQCFVQMATCLKINSVIIKANKSTPKKESRGFISLALKSTKSPLDFKLWKIDGQKAALHATKDASCRTRTLNCPLLFATEELLPCRVIVESSWIEC